MPDYLREKHHFIPAFAQQPWVTRNDGLVCELRLISGRGSAQTGASERHWVPAQL